MRHAPSTGTCCPSVAGITWALEWSRLQWQNGDWLGRFVHRPRSSESWHAVLRHRPETTRTRSLPDAKLPKHDVQDVFRVHDADQFAQCVGGMTHMDRSDAHR